MVENMWEIILLTVYLFQKILFLTYKQEEASKPLSNLPATEDYKTVEIHIREPR